MSPLDCSCFSISDGFLRRADTFGNYLCQKLLEYSTDEQRNIICESVATDLVNISLNLHGTRAVQKMFHFLSTRSQLSHNLVELLPTSSTYTVALVATQTDHRYNGQTHSIIVTLSLHVIVLIKDPNGIYVIQKCLNKLAPEDNQVCFRFRVLGYLFVVHDLLRP